MEILIVAPLLPLFPLSMVYTTLFGRLTHPWARAALLLFWPQAGLLALAQTDANLADGVVVWALASALLYALRALALREAGLWIAFMAVSCWTLLWLFAATPAPRSLLHWQALGLSAPLVLLTVLNANIARRFGAAYAGVSPALAHCAPKLAGILTLTVLAAVATPLFPGFFILFALVMHTAPTTPWAAVAIASVWLLWSWSGARLIQGLVVGPAGSTPLNDLGAASLWAYGIGLTALGLAGILLAGALL